jgi:uncharacterized SAM-binding protein YcdF (DUF218 family)
MALLIIGALALVLGVSLFLWRGRPMLFGCIVGCSVAAWCALWALCSSSLVHRILVGVVLAGIVVFGALEGIILSRSQEEITEEPTAIVVLGAAVWNNEPSPMLEARLETALTYWQAHPELTIVVTGGQGTDEPESEGATMARFLREAGVPEEKLLLEGEAYNTAENLKFSAALLEENGVDTEHLLVVSNGYHLCRVELLAGRLGLNISTLAAPTPGTVLTKGYYYARESLGLVKSWLMDG